MHSTESDAPPGGLASAAAAAAGGGSDMGSSSSHSTQSMESAYGNVPTALSLVQQMPKGKLLFELMDINNFAIIF
jgi:hypothetical protein